MLITQEKWVDLEEISNHFAVSTSTIIRWEKKGLPVHKVGRIKRYNLEDCDKWFKEKSNND